MDDSVRRRGRPLGFYAAGATLLVSGVLAGVGAASAAENDVTVTADTTPAFTPAVVPIATGETVTWVFPSGDHNVASSNDVPADPRWKDFATATGEGPYTFQFVRSGTYTYYCQVHTQMTGVINVAGDPVGPDPTVTPTPTPTASPTATATATATPTATVAPPPTSTGTTPAPTGTTVADTTAPAVTGLRAAVRRRSVRVRFTLDETSNVTVRLARRGARSALKTLRLQLRPGAQTVNVRSGRLARGRYVVDVRARDAAGNRSALRRASLRVPAA